MRTLTTGGLEKDHVQELVRTVVRLQDNNIKPVKVFPKGIPRPDSVEVHAVLDRNNLASIVDVLRQIERVDSIRIFPKGIPVPDVFLAEIGLR